MHAGEIENGVPKPWVDTDQSGRAALALTSMQGERVKADIRVLSTLHKVISGDRQMVFLGSVIIVRGTVAAQGDNLDTSDCAVRPSGHLFLLLLQGKSAESIIIPDVAYDPGESDSSLALSLHTLALFS